MPIVPGQAARSKSADTDAYWRHYYQTHDEKPEALREKVALLNINKKFRDVQAVLAGYLQFHAKNAEPWMYEGLALAIKMNGGSEKDVRTSLGYAADLAVKSRNPNFLVSVADQMLLNGELERVGPLLDQAADLVPHRGEPLLLSINLAQRTKDPKRLGDAVDRLLGLGWPGIDEGVRRDARRQVETLAKQLREEGKTSEADELTDRLTRAEARDVFVRLTWVGDADLDLAVDEPLGATARYQTPRTVFGGSIIKNGYGSHPEEVYVCPRGFDGTYTVRIDTVYNNPDKPALSATLELITHEGTAEEQKTSKTISLAGGKAPEPVTLVLKGGRRTKSLPYVLPTTVTVPRALVDRMAETQKKAAAKNAAAAKAKPTAPASKPR